MVWSHWRSCQREPGQGGCASNTSQLGSTQPKKPRHKLARQGTPGFPQPPPLHTGASGVLNLCHPPYVCEVRKHSRAERHSEPDRYLCAAAGSPQAYNNTDTDQFRLAVGKKSGGVDIKHYLGSVTPVHKIKKDWCRSDATCRWLLFHAFPKWNQVRNVSHWWCN